MAGRTNKSPNQVQRNQSSNKLAYGNHQESTILKHRKVELFSSQKLNRSKSEIPIHNVYDSKRNLNKNSNSKISKNLFDSHASISPSRSFVPSSFKFNPDSSRIANKISLDQNNGPKAKISVFNRKSNPLASRMSKTPKKTQKNYAQRYQKSSAQNQNFKNPQIPKIKNFNLAKKSPINQKVFNNRPQIINSASSNQSSLMQSVISNEDKQQLSPHEYLVDNKPTKNTFLRNRYKSSKNQNIEQKNASPEKPTVYYALPGTFYDVQNHENGTKKIGPDYTGSVLAPVMDETGGRRFTLGKK